MAPPQSLNPVDAVVVLTGGSNRIDSGFDLLRKGAGKKLFISGVYHGIEVKELMKLLRQEDGEKLECCIALGGAENTVENARESVEWLGKEGFHSFYLVTANYHMKRALLEFANVGPDLDVIPYPVSPDKLDMKIWWRDETFRGLIIREYSKYIFAAARSAFLRSP